MELETMHDREFYLAKAKEHKLLEDVLSGATTLKGHLDYLIGGLENPLLVKRGESLRGFREYLTLLVDLEIPLEEKEDLELRAKCLGNRVTNKMFYYFYMTGVGFGGIMLFLPPFSLAEPLVMGISYAGLKATVPLYRLGEDTRKRKGEVFSPLYEIADMLDENIGREFVLDHFMTAKERFEQTYLTLTSDERAPIDDYLHNLLGVGGMKGMDEIQLNDYLTGILESGE